MSGVLWDQTDEQQLPLELRRHLAANGLRQGFIMGVLQLVGFVAGAFIGSRVGPLLLEKLRARL